MILLAAIFEEIWPKVKPNILVRKIASFKELKVPETNIWPVLPKLLMLQRNIYYLCSHMGNCIS